MKTYILTLLCLGALCLGTLNAEAADRYISDILVVTLRDAPNRTSNIIGHVRSGDYMTVLEEQDNGYLRVRISSGLEGWIPKKYTSEGKSKDSIIAGLKRTISKLERLNSSQQQKNTALVEQVNDFQSTIDTISTREAKQQARIIDLEKQVAEAQDKYITLKDQVAGVEKIYAENEVMQKDNASLTKELEVLRIENRELDQTKNIFWFLSGAAVFLIGCIIGRSGRKSRRNSLTL